MLGCGVAAGGACMCVTTFRKTDCGNSLISILPAIFLPLSLCASRCCVANVIAADALNVSSGWTCPGGQQSTFMLKSLPLLACGGADQRGA